MSLCIKTKFELQFNNIYSYKFANMVKCKIHECNKRAGYGYVYKEHIYCKDHKDTDMIDTLNRICKCNKRASFGMLNDDFPTCCKNCKSDKMWLILKIKNVLAVQSLIMDF